MRHATAAHACDWAEWEHIRTSAALLVTELERARELAGGDDEGAWVYLPSSWLLRAGKALAGMRDG
jgi:hypothetical protein